MKSMILLRRQGMDTTVVGEASYRTEKKRLKGNMEMNLKKIGCKDDWWREMAQDYVQRWALGSAVVSYQKFTYLVVAAKMDLTATEALY